MFPLHLAALNAHSECCRKLLSSGNAQLSRLGFHISVEMKYMIGSDLSPSLLSLDLCGIYMFSVCMTGFSVFHSPIKNIRLIGESKFPFCSSV